MKHAAREAPCRWYLTGHLTEESVQAIDIDRSPFQIGRRAGLSLTLPQRTVSSMHAEMVLAQDSLLIKDLNSTNGTYRNGKRITETVSLSPGDLLHFADVPFRINRDPTDESSQRGGETDGGVDSDLSLSDFDQFLSMRSVIPHFQPIVSLTDRRIVGYEVLARGRMPGLETPDEMFLAASQLNLEAELSRMLRLVGFEKGMKVHCLFINTHVAEIGTLRLLESLRRFRDANAVQQVTIEIREPVGQDTAAIQQLREALASLNMQLSYDHFGCGRSRRAELAAVRPDYLKFDMELTREIHLAPAAQKSLLTNLVRMVRELGIVPVASGVECESEHNTCRDIGFEVGQGFFYGKPMASADVVASVGRTGKV
jgi:EAL domain-containing protein (putative c-di-GMP-specific phosphodiesterase class I)